MEIIKSYAQEFNEELKSLQFPEKPTNLYDPLRYFMQLGGKRIRPLLVLMATELFNGKTSSALNAAKAVELFHNFSLIHDDIMDEAPLRRNQVTVHEKWNRDIAILSGDVLFTKAFELIAACEDRHIPSLMKVFTRVAREVCEGQQMDMDFEEKIHITIPEYIEMIRLKTSVLLGGALEMGSIIAEARPLDQKHIYDFGEKLGIAFQIQDDILDLYGDPDKVGKRVGGDVVANKKTLLLLSAYTRAGEEELQMLDAIMSIDDEKMKVEQARSLFDQLNVRKACVELQEIFYKEALESLEQISVANENKRVLTHFAEEIMNRNY